MQLVGIFTDGDLRRTLQQVGGWVGRGWLPFGTCRPFAAAPVPAHSLRLQQPRMQLTCGCACVVRPAVRRRWA